MYEDYGFVLEWSDLSEELQAEKIDAFITYNYDMEIEHYKEAELSRMSLAETLEDPAERKSAEDSISAHFPVYF